MKLVVKPKKHNWAPSTCLRIGIRAGKTRTHSAATLPRWSCFPNIDLFSHACNICGGHKNVSENLQKHFLCPRGLQQCFRVLPRTGNIVGHNVAATLCRLRFAEVLGQKICVRATNVARVGKRVNIRETYALVSDVAATKCVLVLPAQVSTTPRPPTTAATGLYA